MASLGAVSLGATLLTTTPLVANAMDDGGALYGANRYETAYAIASSLYDNSVDNLNEVVIASGRNFPDALVGGSIAARKGAPLLLADTDVTPWLLDYLRGTKVTIIGGLGAVSNNAEAQLKNATLNVQRVGGANRYDTAVKALQTTFAGHQDTVFVASGANFPDALAGSAMAGKLGAPMMITNPGGMDEATLNLLRSYSPSKVYVLGGRGAVSDAVINQVHTVTGNVERLEGADRYQTSVAIANRLAGGTTNAYVASGVSFADALAAGPIAAKRGMPIYLSPKDYLPVGIPGGVSLVRVGGPGVLSPTLVTNRRPAANQGQGVSVEHGTNTGNSRRSTQAQDNNGSDCFDRSLLGFNYHVHVTGIPVLSHCYNRFPKMSESYAKRFKEHFVKVWNDERNSKGLVTIPMSSEDSAMTAEVQDEAEKIADGRLPFEHPAQNNPATAGAENIIGVPYSGDPELDAESAFQGWKESPGHYKNMLTDWGDLYAGAKYFKWGLGVAIDTRGDYPILTAQHRIMSISGPNGFNGSIHSKEYLKSEEFRKLVVAGMNFKIENGDCFMQDKNDPEKKWHRTKMLACEYAGLTK